MPTDNDWRGRGPAYGSASMGDELDDDALDDAIAGLGNRDAPPMERARLRARAHFTDLAAARAVEQDRSVTRLRAMRELTLTSSCATLYLLWALLNTVP